MSDLFAGAPHCYSDDEAIQRALISEHGAEATYQSILRNTTSNRIKEIITEIITDEQNHQGRLQGLLIEIRGGEEADYSNQFCAGLMQKEAGTDA